MPSRVIRAFDSFEILAFFQLLLVASQETTTNLLNNAVLCFSENPGELAQLRAAPELLPSAIEEVLRYRSPNLHLAFGHGIHFCLGAALARLEARLALSDLLEKMERFELKERTWEPRAALHVLGPTRLSIRFKLRSSG